MGIFKERSNIFAEILLNRAGIMWIMSVYFPHKRDQTLTFHKGFIREKILSSLMKTANFAKSFELLRQSNMLFVTCGFQGTARISNTEHKVPLKRIPICERGLAVQISYSFRSQHQIFWKRINISQLKTFEQFRTLSQRR